MKNFSPDQVSVRSAHFIGGKYIETQPNLFEVLRPSDGHAYAGLPVADADMVNRAVENAVHAWKTSCWATQPPRDRARILRRWADLIDADVDTLAAMEAVGSTRPLRDARTWDVSFTAEGIRFFAECADKHGGDVAATGSDQLGMVISEPYGVIGAIAPWNFPLVMASWKVGPALAAGNAVVLKPSEMTPFTALRLAELAIAAGMPAGIFNVIQGNGQVTGDSLCRHPGISKVTFTGSTRTGAAIMRACAETGTKPVTLELGGKSPQIVFADAPDLANVAGVIARAISGNAGQVCNAGSRLIVQRSVAERIVGDISTFFSTLKAGHTWACDTTLSPIISNTQADRIESIVGRSVQAGAQVVSGGQRASVAGNGAYYLPTILTGLCDGMDALTQEIFGPVLTVQVFDEESEALALADHPDYGLAAGLYTADLGRAMRFARGLEAGNVWINRYGRSADFVIPTGGYKRSGIGKDLGKQAFEASRRSKSVLIDLTK